MADHQALLQRQRLETRQASQIALERAKTCLPVTDTPTGHNAPIVEGAAIWTDGTAKVPLNDGRFVCNALGDTAVVIGGIASSIKSVSASDLPEYLEIFNAAIEERRNSAAQTNRRQ